MVEHNEGGNLKYAQIIDGKFAVRSSADEALDANGKMLPNYRSRALQKGANAGQLVYEWVFDSMTGTISRMELRDSTFGKQLSINFTGSDGEVIAVSMTLKNESGTLTAPAASFGDQIGIVDLSTPVKIGLSKKDGKVRGVALSQNGDYIPNTKENEKFAAHIANRPQPVDEFDEIDKVMKKNWKNPSLWQANQIMSAIDRLEAMGVGNVVPTQATTTQPTQQATAPVAPDEPPFIPKLDDLPF